MREPYLIHQDGVPLCSCVCHSMGLAPNQVLTIRCSNVLLPCHLLSCCLIMLALCLPLSMIKCWSAFFAWHRVYVDSPWFVPSKKIVACALCRYLDAPIYSYVKGPVEIVLFRLKWRWTSCFRRLKYRIKVLHQDAIFVYRTNVGTWTYPTYYEEPRYWFVQSQLSPITGSTVK